MNIRKIATITVLVLSSFAATNVGPTKAELEGMYDKAFREFNANNYSQALKELDAIDARQPDLAESQNLRGVILMRQADYDHAEAALQKALATDPKFWNARFNLAEIPFLRKDWTEARKRFDALLQGNAVELQGEAAQLIQYKILLTYLLQDNENMVDSILAKFELSPETPAANYASAAIAFQHKHEKEAKDLVATAEKNFSPQLNKLFAESLYEVGWLQKPVGQTRAALELTSAADQLAKAKALATEKYEQAELAFQQRDLTTARRLVDEADAADPNQATTINLRGEILLAQKDFDGAESAFRQAAKLDPKMPEAQYNLAQIPFKKKEYAKARDRFEALFGATAAPGGDKNQTAQIIKFNIYLTLLLEGKDARAQKMMEQFKFTGDTPALYYAQAAWEFKHSNTAKANDWIVSARKIYSPALNFVFADSFYDLGWLQSQSKAPTAASAEVAKVEATPSIEASPIAAPVLALNEPAKQPSEILTQKLPPTAPESETTTADVPKSSSSAQTVVAKNESDATAPASSSKVEMPAASNPLPAETRDTMPRETEHRRATGPATSAAVTQQNPASTFAKKVVAPPIAAAPVRSAGQTWSPPTVNGRSSNSTLIMSILLIAGILLLAWVVISELRRRVSVSAYRSPVPATGPSFDEPERETTGEKIVESSQLAGGPPQISLQLKASEPSVRRAAVPFGKMSRPFGAAAGAPGNGTVSENLIPREMAPMPEPAQFDEWKSPSITESVPAPEAATDPQFAEDLTRAFSSEIPEVVSTPDWEFSPIRTETASTRDGVVSPPKGTPTFAETPVGLDAPMAFEAPAPIEAVSEPALFETPAFFETVGEPMPMPSEIVAESLITPAAGISGAELDAPIEFEAPVPIEAVSEPVTSEMPAFYETVGEPIPMPSEIVAESLITPAAGISGAELDTTIEFETPVTSEMPAFYETVGEPIPMASEIAAESRMTPVSEISEVESDASIEFETPAPFEAVSEPVTSETPAFQEAVGEPIPMPSEIVAESLSPPADEIYEAEIEPVAQGQPIPYQVPAFSNDEPTAEITKPESESRPIRIVTETIMGVVGFPPSVQTPSFAPQVISNEPLAQQPTTPATMPESTQSTQASAIRTAPMTGGGLQPQPASGMHTAVQLTFSFEIASMQLTPSFKMGALQLKPTSKIVTMRLAPSQQPQPAMNLQVTFEISTVQLAGNAIGMIRLTPSQQQRPGVISSPAFNVAGLQLLAGTESSGAVQITPSQQGQASVHVTGRFQIATVEFSPSFEIASIVLNSTSKNVSVQLPGAGPSAVEGAPVFEVSNVQLAGNGEIGMMHLTAQGAVPKPA